MGGSVGSLIGCSVPWLASLFHAIFVGLSVSLGSFFGGGDRVSKGGSVRDIRCSLKREPRFGGMEGTEEPGRSKFIVVFDVLRCGLWGWFC